MENIHICLNAVLPMFIYIVILAFRKGGENVREYCVELGVIAVALLQSVGSNILAFQLTTPIFWYAVGRMFADEGPLKKEVTIDKADDAQEAAA